MSPESVEPQQSVQETVPKARLEIEESFQGFIPEAFKIDPMTYFEERGINIKSGEVVRDETGRVREDPTAVKDLPVWSNERGETLQAVGKRVNTAKSQVGKTGDPFYEYRIMEIAQEFGLPAPRPIAKVEQGSDHLIIMTRIPGLRWVDRDALLVHSQGVTEEDIRRLRQEAELMMEGLRERYERIGIYRTWNIKDMVFDIDLENKKINAITPTDWERTKIDPEKLEEARKARMAS